VVQQRVERRLAAILAADIVGYSRLMGADEAGTARDLRGHLDAVRPVIASLGGRVVKTTGDGVLLEFPSVVAAVECAVAVQRLMAKRNADVPEERRMVYRIGINLGDILIDGDDILGDGVNVAARLEGIAEPGGICLSEDAYRQVRGKVPVEFVDMGEPQLKNIARPVRVYALDAQSVPSMPEAPASPQQEQARRPPRFRLAVMGLAGLVLVAAALWLVVTRAYHPGELASAPRLSIVVLPFANLSGDPAQDYLADVLTEELTTGLSRISGTFVIARSTAFTYKGKPVDVKQVGKDLGGRYVLEGSE
jgi:adenylate cyclase